MAAANLDCMHVETPIRAGKLLGKARRPLSQKSLGQGDNTVTHGGNDGSQLNGRSAPATNGHGIDREERLLRLVDILRTKQVSASIVAESEVGRTGLRRWRGPCLLAVVIILMGAGAILYASRPIHIFSDARPASPAEPGHPIQSNLPAKIGLQLQPRGGAGDTRAVVDKSFSPSLIAPFPEGLTQGNPLQPPPTVERKGSNRSGTADTATPLDDSIMETKPVDVPAPKHEADPLASPTSAAAIGDVAGSVTNKPTLIVYFPRGSLRAETKARSLPARFDSDFAKSDFEAQSTLPDGAVIRFSGESNHKLARVVGKSLGDWGYQWRIENSSSPVTAGRNTIEVWLPR